MAQSANVDVGSRSHADALSGSILHLRLKGAAHLQIVVIVFSGWLQRVLAVASSLRLKLKCSVVCGIERVMY